VTFRPQGDAPVFAALDAALTAAEPEELPALVGRLVEAEERARLRLRAFLAPNPPPPTASAWIPPGAAAEIAAVSVKRIYEWARKASWASRPTKRCLRVNEAAFRTWISRRG
jgi:hypothetical protein